MLFIANRFGLIIEDAWNCDEIYCFEAYWKFIDEKENYFLNILISKNGYRYGIIKSVRITDWKIYS